MADKKNGTQAAGLATKTETASNRKQLPKVEAVRRAMTALGKEASRADIQGYVRQKFGIKIGLDHISNCKGELAKRAGKGATPTDSESAAAKLAAAPAASGKHNAPQSRAAQSTPAAHTRAVGGNGSSQANILLDDVLTAKILIDRVGAGPLKRLIDGLAK